ncbi:MAG: hypothetical protein Q4P26_11610 [Lachnospiraceae bacterium]|nr:hypothetical protein [Lachnospiraceae bacterium]
MKYHKAGPVYRRISYEPGFLMILQAAKRTGNIRLTVEHFSDTL